MTDAAARPVLDLPAVEHALFTEAKARSRIVRDYSLDPVPITPAGLAQALVAALGQRPRPEPLDADVPDREVYRAAVLALASNSRSWSTFIANEPRLRELLRDYDPHASELSLDALRACIPGQTSGADARAMLAWADLIAGADGYYRHLVAAARALERAGVGADEVTPCVAALIGAPPSDQTLARCLPGLQRPWKAPGMGPTLAMEFLRNLGWSGFKPDRHIQRLLGAWFPDVVAACRPRATELAGLLGTRSKDLVAFFTFCLVGQAVTPPGRTFSEADNLVWALGAYVERKGRESEMTYRVGGADCAG